MEESFKHLNITELSWENRTHIPKQKNKKRIKVNLSRSTIDIRGMYLHLDLFYFKKQ